MKAKRPNTKIVSTVLWHPVVSDVFLIVLLLSCLCAPAQQSDSPDYDQLVVNANSLLKQGELDQAQQAVQQAIKLNGTNYLAYAVAAKIASKQGDSGEANSYAQKALEFAPDDRKDQVQELANRLAPAVQSESPPPAALSDEDRLTLTELSLLMDKAGNAATPEEKTQACGDILSRSESLAKLHPEQTNVWIMRGVAAVVLGRAHEGWEAGQHLKDLGMVHNDNPEALHLLAELDLKGWLGQEPQFPKMDEPWTNSLGQVFVPVPGTKVLFGIWDVRVEDYRAYANANSGVDGSWQNPQFEGVAVTASEECPVVNVCWNDAEAFCAWLTQQERAAGKISDSQSYRLPTDVEWSVAVGSTKYPWGDAWPPPPGAGNYADSTMKASFSGSTVIDGYTDGYATTSPVGSFNANQYGLYDMGGNVWQWCEDESSPGSGSRVLRGAAWYGGVPGGLLSAFRYPIAPDDRNIIFGFRCVLVAGASR